MKTEKLATVLAHMSMAFMGVLSLVFVAACTNII